MKAAADMRKLEGALFGDRRFGLSSCITTVRSLTTPQGDSVASNGSIWLNFLGGVAPPVQMGKCEAAYMPGENLGSGPYSELAKALDSILETRLITFMNRHPNIFKQFAEEDATGLR